MKINCSFFESNSMFYSLNIFSNKKIWPSTSVAGNEVNVGQGLTYLARNNGLNIHGNKSFESVVVLENVTDIKIDSFVESVTFFNVSYNPSLLKFYDTGVTVNSALGTSIASLNVAENHQEILSFSNASGWLSLDNTGGAVFNLSNIILDKNQNYSVNSNNLTVYGNSGVENVTITNNVRDVVIARSVENVIFDGKSSDYNCSVVGNTVVVSSKISGNDIAQINVATASSGTQVHFADKTISAVLSDNPYWKNGWSFHNWSVILNDPAIEVPAPLLSGGTNLKYTVDFSHAVLGSNLANVQANVKTALDNIGKYIGSNVVFNLDIRTDNTSTNILAETSATMVNINDVNGATQTTKFMADSARGIESSPNTADAKVFINLSMLNEMSFSNIPTANKYDLTSILTHEILHGLAFTGNLNQTSSSSKTPFDVLVAIQNTTPSFIGTHAMAAYGGIAVPLDSSSAGQGSAYYHVAISNDLMSDSIGKGEVRAISSLDIAMLQDLGLTLVGIGSAAV